jgi:hypothetical protein
VNESQLGKFLTPLQKGNPMFGASVSDRNAFGELHETDSRPVNDAESIESLKAAMKSSRNDCQFRISLWFDVVELVSHSPWR